MSFSEVNDDSTKTLNVVGDWIYYVNEDDAGCIYKIRTDRTERKMIGNGTRSHQLNVVGNWIYYVHFDRLIRIEIIKSGGLTGEVVY